MDSTLAFSSHPHSMPNNFTSKMSVMVGGIARRANGATRR
jgi:hypothetical protein